MFPLLFGTKLHQAVQEACAACDKENPVKFEAVLDQIRSDKDACLAENADGLTPIELALSLQPEGHFAAEMMHVECDNRSSEECFKTFIARGNLRLLLMLVDRESKRIGHTGMMTGMTMAFAELRTRNVQLAPEVVNWLQYLLVEADYQQQSAEDNRLAVKEHREWRLRHLVECIEYLEKHHRDSGCRLSDMGERFLLYVRQIFEHVFFLKNWLKDLPLMQLQFCLAIFLGTVTGGRNEEVDIFGFMIDKDTVLNFLSSLKMVLADYWDVRNLSARKLFEYVTTKEHNRPKVFTSMLQNRLYYSEFLQIKTVQLFDQLSSTQTLRLDRICIELQKQWTIATQRKHFRKLLRTYFTAKQFYSVRKIISSIEAIHNLDLQDPSKLPVSIAALKRTLQIIGEATKSSKQTPNITRKLDTILSMFPSKSFVELAKELRQFFSHDYSLAKDRLDQHSPIEIFRSTLATLKNCLRWLSYVSFLQNNHVFRQYLGKLYRMRSIDQMRSYVNFIGMEFKAKLIPKYEPTDVLDSIALVEKLIDTSRGESEKQQLMVILNDLTIHRNAIRNDVATMGYAIDQFFFLEMYIAQAAANIDRVRTIVKCMLNDTARPQRHMSVDKSLTKVAANAIARLQNDESDPERKILLDELWKRLVRQNTTAIESLKHHTTVHIDQCLDETIKILTELNMAIDDEEFVQMVNRRLKKKYFYNLFDLNNKYHVLNDVIKDRRVASFSKQLKLRLTTMRSLEEDHFQQKFDAVIESIRKIIVKYGNVEETLLVRLKQEDRFAIEYHLLEACEILCSLNIFKDNAHAMGYSVPVITGRNLRNCLAHDCLSYQTLAGNASAILTSALYLIQHPIKLYGKCISTVVLADSVSANTFSFKLEWINKQQTFFKAIEAFDIDQLKRLTSIDKINILQRNQLDNDFVTIALNSQPATFIDHLRNPSVEPNFFIWALNEPIAFKLRTMLHTLLNDHRAFCFTTSIRFELIDHIRTLSSNKRQLHREEIERILRSYSPASIPVVLDCLSVEQFLVDARFRNTIIHWAVLRGDLELVRFSLRRHRSLINEHNVFGETALALAVRYGFLDIVNALLECEANINLGKWHPLWIASKLNDLELIPYLIDDTTERCPPRNNPLMGALMQNNLDFFVSLHEVYGFGYEVDELLHRAINLNRARFVQYILSSKQGVRLLSSLNSVRLTPLMMAAVCGRTSIFRHLLLSGADPTFVNESGFTALHCAVYSNKRIIIDTLLDDHRLDINAAAEGELTALNIAIGKRNAQNVRYLISKGATVTTNHLIQAGYYKAYNIMQTLLEHSPELLNEAKDVYNRTLLMYAVIDRDLPVVDYLIAKGSDLDARTRGGLTALHIAASNNYLEMCDRLIDAGCNMEAQDDFKRTALTIAVEHEFIVLAKHLLARGSSSDPVRSHRFDLYKASFLHKFAYENRFYMVRFLLDHCAFDRSLLDASGRTALDHAKEQGNDAIIELLTTSSTAH